MNKDRSTKGSMLFLQVGSEGKQKTSLMPVSSHMELYQVAEKQN